MMPDLETIKLFLAQGGAYALLAFIVVVFVWKIYPGMISDFKGALKEQRDDLLAELKVERDLRESWMKDMNVTISKLSDRIDNISKGSK